MPKAAGHSVSAALYPHIHIDFKLAGWRKYFYPILFKSIRKVTDNKHVNLLHWNILIKSIDHLGQRGVPKLHHLGKQGISIFYPLVKSYRNKAYPKLYSTVLNHDTMTEVMADDSEGVMQDYYKFGFVRHPADWLVSIFFFLRQRPHLKELYESVMKFEDFRQFVNYLFEFRNTGKTKDVLGSLPFKVQTDFLFDQNDNCVVDKIGRLENFKDDFIFILNQIGIESELKHGNRSNHDDFTTYYDEELWDKACVIMERDFRLLSYESSYEIMRNNRVISN